MTPNRSSLLAEQAPLRRKSLSPLERIGIAALVVVLAAWALMPSIAQDPSYHRYADQRSWAGMPYAANVLSNVPFALVGIAALIRLCSRRERLSAATEAGMACVALGITLTAAGSAWYHLDPTNATLVWDRVPMTLVFGGIIATAIAQRIGERAARSALALLVPLGVASVVYWKASGDLSLYALLQYGGIAALVLLLATTRGSRDPFPWVWVIGCYAAAKIAESADRALWDATQSVVSGHTLKHLCAAAAAAAALWPLFRMKPPALEPGSRHHDSTTGSRSR